MQTGKAAKCDSIDDLRQVMTLQSVVFQAVSDGTSMRPRQSAPQHFGCPGCRSRCALGEPKAGCPLPVCTLISRSADKTSMPC